MSKTIREILDKKGWGAIVVKQCQPIRSVAKFLTINNIGAAPVMDDHGGIVGMLSDRDIVRYLGEIGEELVGKTAGDVMTRLVAACEPHDATLDVMRLMTSMRCRHIPVLEDGALLGIVSIGDVVKARLEEAEYDADAMRTYVTTC